jgi:hypothetical protein
MKATDKTVLRDDNDALVAEAEVSLILVRLGIDGRKFLSLGTFLLVQNEKARRSESP